MPLFTSILTLTYLCSPPDYSCVAGVAGPQRDQRDRQRQLQGQRQEADQGRSGHQEARRCPLQVNIDQCYQLLSFNDDYLTYNDRNDS